MIEISIKTTIQIIICPLSSLTLLAKYTTIINIFNINIFNINIFNSNTSTRQTYLQNTNCVTVLPSQVQYKKYLLEKYEKDQKAAEVQRWHILGKIETMQRRREAVKTFQAKLSVKKEYESQQNGSSMIEVHMYVHLKLVPRSNNFHHIHCLTCVDL